jgi:MFS family permease
MHKENMELQDKYVTLGFGSKRTRAMWNQEVTATLSRKLSKMSLGWRVALASSTCVLVSFASLLVYTFAIFLRPLSTEFGWSREAVSLAFGIAALAVAACSPPLGWLLDRYPARRIILPCLTVFGCAFASLSLLTRHLWQLYATFLILGVVGNGTAHLAYSRVLTAWFRERRGVAFSLLLGGGAVGAMILPPIAEALIHAAGWRVSFGILGAAVLVVGLPCGSRVRAPAHSTHSAEVPASGAAVREGLRSRVFWIIVAELSASPQIRRHPMQGHGTKFGRKKEQAIAALLTQRNMEDAARVAGISLAALKRWTELPEFKAAYLQARRAIRPAAQRQR